MYKKTNTPTIEEWTTEIISYTFVGKPHYHDYSLPRKLYKSDQHRK